MSVTRGTFLKSLGKSLPGMVLGSGATIAAQKFLAKIAAVSGEAPAPATPLAVELPKIKKTPVEFISRGPATGNKIALTFDDGPTPGVTELILDELKQRGLHATFFMIGQCIADAPDLARRVVAEGHEVGNHTYTHPRLTELSSAAASEEIAHTQDFIAEVLGLRPTWFRPPFGAFHQSQAPLAIELGLRVAMWSVDTGDWAQPGEQQIIASVLDDARPGSIILCHDKHDQTARAVGPMLDGLLGRGFSPVTMSNLMAG